MRMLILFLVAGLAAAAPLRAQSTIRIIEGPVPEIWLGQADQGEITHRRSSVRFPAALGEFGRFRVMAINDGDDVGLNYRHRRGDKVTVVTVFLFKPGSLPEHRLSPAVANVGLRSPEAFLWSDGPFDIPASTPLRAYKASFKSGLGADTVMDYLYFAPLGGWTVKVRATMESPKDLADEREIDALVRALPWMEILKANGKCRGTACSSNQAVPFNSHSAELMLPRLFSAAKAKKGVRQEKPVYQHRGYSLFPFDEKLAPLFSETYGALSLQAPLYSVWHERGKRTLVRFYAGLPSKEQFERAVDILARTPESSDFLLAAEAARHVPD